ncbi:MAG: hypothetical protein PHE36_00780 [Novosphingobium sp.]|nr:hypothetical protein [Novosphingobium sp.]
MSPKLILPLALLPLLAACASPGQPRPSGGDASRVPPTVPQRPAPRWRPAHAMDMPGLEGVIGADAGALVRQFGQPRLDVIEGDARKLQFSGRPCVLDVYLYPPAQGADPRAAYVDARRESDGQDVDRAACVAALRRR